MMKLGRALLPAFLVLVGCASAQRPEPAASATPTAAKEPASEEATSKTAAELWAEKKVAAETESAKKKEKREPGEALDPLAMGSELEEASIPVTAITPRRQIRAKSPGELVAAMGLVRSASSVEDAAKKLTVRLGNPSWTEAPRGAEGAKRRIWVATVGGQCQRLVLEADGSVELETAAKTERRMLSASARQNPCTGEIERGLSAK